ncbi:MAG: type II secretion system F family protein [Minisyncoccia bacterium]
MLFNYKAIDNSGVERAGIIDAINIDAAIASLQKRGLIVSSVKPEGDKKGFLNLSFGGVKNKDIVILSRQIATMFEAQISALRVFRMIATEVDNPVLARVLTEVSDDIQAGSPISVSLNKHPKIFTPFYISMVRSGEESGHLDKTFMYLADYMDRAYEVSSKVKNALIYPIFVAFTFLVVMLLMFTMVIPKISDILRDSGQAIPFYTSIILAISSFLVNYGIFLVIILIVGGFFFWRYSRTESGRLVVDNAKITTPYIQKLYMKLYLSRIADNLNTLLISGIPVVRALELTASVVGNKVYEAILTKSIEDVKGGQPVSQSLSGKREFPGIFIQMIKVGEETGEMGSILKTMSTFYRREVINTVDTIVGLIEPIMIVALGLGVGILLAAVLVPIYNISASM